MSEAAILPAERVVEATRARAGVPFTALLRRPGAAISLFVLAVLVPASFLAPLVAPYAPDAIDPIHRFLGPTSQHLFGTDELGRDLFSRVLYGGRLSFGIAAASTVLALLGGIIWGMVAAVRSGWTDDILMRAADALMAIPFLVLSLIVVAAFGASLLNLILILGLLQVPWTARITRAATLGEASADYCLAARAYGAPLRRLLFSEILPNIRPTLLVQASLVAANVILTEATLSFIGLGIQPPAASWGTLLQDGYNNIQLSTWYIVWPGLMIFIVVCAFNTLADHLQAILDPRSARQSA